MRRLLAVAVPMLLVAFVPVAGGQGTVDVDFGAASPDREIDLQDDRGATLRFQASDGDFDNMAGDADSAVVELVCACTLRTETITLPMQRSGGDWQASLAVNDPDLVEGTWLATARAVQGAGSFNTPSASIEVTAPQVGALVVRALNTDDSGVIKVREGQDVQISVSFEVATPAPLVRSVEYRIGSNPDFFDWSAPYRLSADNFQPPGMHPVQVQVEDRMGRTQALGFAVYADAVKPVVTPTTPAVFYQGIPNPVVLQVTEHSSFTATALVAGVQATATGRGQQTVHLDLTPDELGPTSLEIIVTDEVGNERRLLEQTTVERLVSDVVLVEALQVGQPIPGEDVRLRVTASQIDGLADIPVNVTFGGLDLGEMTVNKTVESSAEFVVDVPPGRHTETLALTAPPKVNELDATNQEANATVERFLARVLHGADRYHIRADASGLPLEAVDENGATYAIRLDDRGLGTVYAFTADGHELYWHPASTTTVVPEQEETETEDNGIPALPLAALVALLAVGAVRRRR